MTAKARKTIRIQQSDKRERDTHNDRRERSKDNMDTTVGKEDNKATARGKGKEGNRERQQQQKRHHEKKDNDNREEADKRERNNYD